MDQVTVEHRGLALIVKLPKVLQDAQFSWPRLLATKQPARWLKNYQKFEGLQDEEEDQIRTVIPQDSDFKDSDEVTADIEYLT